MKKPTGLTRREFMARSSLAATAVVAVDGVPVSNNNEDQEIVRAAIHPAIGVARVGNSESDFFIGPEVTDPPLTQFQDSHDSQGAIKRQAARFRIYGYNAQGEVVRELTADAQTQVEWTVHLVNKKADWFQFTSALDSPDAQQEDASVQRRNPELRGEERQTLVIDPGPRSIRPGDSSSVAFDSGSFMGIPVYLGELRTDEQGRLLVLPGKGQSGSPDPERYKVYEPEKPESFNNASGWYDDIADGPVHATLRYQGKSIPVESAWVVSAPPNYAPDIISFRTLYDLLVDRYLEEMRNGRDPFPGDKNSITQDVVRQLEKTSFRKDVLPALIRLTRLQWVNKGFADKYGHRQELDFENPDLLSDLAQPKPEHEYLRRQIYEIFRTSDKTQPEDPNLAPELYGDAFGSYMDSPEVNLSVSGLRELHLRRWVQGQFVNDWDLNFHIQPKTLDQVSLQEQPGMLDKAALHFCLADAYHPGCELTWPMRHLSMYSSPFRIKQREPSSPSCGVEDCGDTLTTFNVKLPDGPLHGQSPGDLTRWMALPWQGDTIYCRSGYNPNVHPFLPAYWPARVPNQVLTESDYLTVMNESLPIETRIRSFQRRRHWTRPIRGVGAQPILEMVKRFAEMGIVEMRPGPTDTSSVFPKTLFVETLPRRSRNGETRTLADPPTSTGVDPQHQEEPKDPLSKAGWESQEQLELSPFHRQRSRGQ